MATVDVYTYAGEINLRGYESLCQTLTKKAGDVALLVLATPGGDPHAGFRIARALQHTYGTFDALVPRYCKSAGTLVLIGATRLFLDDMSELGPLDVQVKKSDELMGRNSGLDILQAVNYLQVQAMSAFRSYLLELTTETGLSTKVASDISSRLTTGLFEPVFAQIDPMKLAEMQRATEIAFAYGNRLNEKSNNMRTGGLAQLVTGYPSHGFVIDRKEAKTLFQQVLRPEGFIAELGKSLHAKMEKNTYSSNPQVDVISYSDAGAAHEDSPSSDTGAAGNEAGDAADSGSCAADAATASAPSAAPAAAKPNGHAS